MWVVKIKIILTSFDQLEVEFIITFENMDIKRDKGEIHVKENNNFNCSDFKSILREM